MSHISDELVENFNRLVYEYLLKMQYAKTASLFKMEAQLGEIGLNDTPPVLLNWYNIFIETADVRSGKIYVPEALNRIEGIMLKLENDKQRFARMSAIVAHPRKSPGPVLPPFPFDADFPKQEEMGRPPNCMLKEMKRIKFNVPYAYLSHFCPQQRLLLYACSDCKLYFCSLAKNAIEASVPIRSRKSIKLAAIETPEGCFVAYDVDKRVVVLLKCHEGRREEMATVESEHGILSYCVTRDSVVVLHSNSKLGIYSHSGNPVRYYDVSSACFEVEAAGPDLYLVEQSRVVLFDPRAGVEVRVLHKGLVHGAFVKEGLLFVVSSDVISVISDHPRPLCTMKLTVPCVDAIYTQNSVAICTGNGLWYNDNFFSILNAMSVHHFVVSEMPGLLIASSDGAVTVLGTI